MNTETCECELIEFTKRKLHVRIFHGKPQIYFISIVLLMENCERRSQMMITHVTNHRLKKPLSIYLFFLYYENLVGALADEIMIK